MESKLETELQQPITLKSIYRQGHPYIAVKITRTVGECDPSEWIDKIARTIMAAEKGRDGADCRAVQISHETKKMFAAILLEQGYREQAWYYVSLPLTPITVNTDWETTTRKQTDSNLKGIFA